MITKPFTFNSRETYLALRTEWKAEYLAVSNTIRESKNTIKNVQREGNVPGVQVYNLLRNSVSRANTLLELLVEAKQLAQQQYMEQKEACNVCN